MRRPYFRETRWFVIGVVFCGLLALIVTVVVIYAVAALWNLVAP